MIYLFETAVERFVLFCYRIKPLGYICICIVVLPTAEISYNDSFILSLPFPPFRRTPVHHQLNVYIYKLGKTRLPSLNVDHAFATVPHITPDRIYVSEHTSGGISASSLRVQLPPKEKRERENLATFVFLFISVASSLKEKERASCHATANPALVYIYRQVKVRRA